MSRPIQEPATQREIQRLWFGEDQLFRRPAVDPGGRYVTAYLFRTTNLAVVNDTWTRALASADGSDSTDTGILNPNTTNGYIEIITSGIYTVGFVGQYSGSLTAENDAMIYATGTTSITDPGDPDGTASNYVNTWPGDPLDKGKMFHAEAHFQIPFLVQTGILAGPPVRVWGSIHHTEGSDQTMAEATLQVTRHGNIP